MPLESTNITNGKYVIDGRFIQRFELISDSYVTYVEKHFGIEAIVVFDCYENNSKSEGWEKRVVMCFLEAI